jgi:hypothetical protein
MSDRPIDHFTAAESANILLAKKIIQDKLETFNMTIGKIGAMMQHSYFLSGGAIGSLLHGEEPNDYDIYFFFETDAKMVFTLYESDLSYTHEVAKWNIAYRDVDIGDRMITENATTLKNGIQLIRKHYGQPSEIRKTFDFVHCMPYYDSRDKKLYISREQYDLNMSKKLKRNNDNLFQSWREDKFLKRGWTWQ